jgi:hypothetical protein
LGESIAVVCDWASALCSCRQWSTGGGSQHKPPLSNLKGPIPPGIDEGVMRSESDGGSRGRFRHVEEGESRNLEGMD